MPDFNSYAQDYRDIINKVSRISGETYEFFIRLRLSLMKAKLDAIGELPLSILDFGCGIGVTERFFEELFPHSTIRGIDTSAESIRTARELGLHRSLFDVLDSDRLPYTAGSFDLAYSNGTMHHIVREKHWQAISELHRVLCPGGHLFIFENNPLNPLMMRAMRKNPFDADAEVVHPRYLKYMVRQCNFTFRCINYYFFFPKMLSRLRALEKYMIHLPLGAQYFLWATK